MKNGKGKMKNRKTEKLNQTSVDSNRQQEQEHMKSHLHQSQKLFHKALA